MNDDQELKAAILQFRKENRINYVKFAALVLLVITVFGGLLAFFYTITDAIKSALGV